MGVAERNRRQREKKFVGKTKKGIYGKFEPIWYFEMGPVRHFKTGPVSIFFPIFLICRPRQRVNQHVIARVQIAFSHQDSVWEVTDHCDENVTIWC